MPWAGAGCGMQVAAGPGLDWTAAAVLPWAPCVQLHPRGRFLPKSRGVAVGSRDEQRRFSQSRNCCFLLRPGLCGAGRCLQPGAQRLCQLRGAAVMKG